MLAAEGKLQSAALPGEHLESETRLWALSQHLPITLRQFKKKNKNSWKQRLFLPLLKFLETKVALEILKGPPDKDNDNRIKMQKPELFLVFDTMQSSSKKLLEFPQSSYLQCQTLT